MSAGTTRPFQGRLKGHRSPDPRFLLFPVLWLAESNFSVGAAYTHRKSKNFSLGSTKNDRKITLFCRFLIFFSWFHGPNKKFVIFLSVLGKSIGSFLFSVVTIPTYNGLAYAQHLSYTFFLFLCKHVNPEVCYIRETKDSKFTSISNFQGSTKPTKTITHGPTGY